MPEIPEFYPKRQGRPATAGTKDLDSGRTLIDKDIDRLVLESIIFTYEGEVLTHNGSILYRS